MPPPHRVSESSLHPAGQPPPAFSNPVLLREGEGKRSVGRRRFPQRNPMLPFPLPSALSHRGRRPSCQARGVWLEALLSPSHPLGGPSPRTGGSGVQPTYSASSSREKGWGGGEGTEDGERGRESLAQRTGNRARADCGHWNTSSPARLSLRNPNSPQHPV